MAEGLTESSAAILSSLAAFSDKKKNACLRDIEAEISEYTDGSLMDSSYSKSDVRDLMEGLSTILKVTVEKQQQEVVDACNGLLQQVLLSADKAGVAIQADVNAPKANLSGLSSVPTWGLNPLGGTTGLSGAGPSKLPTLAETQAKQQAEEALKAADGLAKEKQSLEDEVKSTEQKLADRKKQIEKTQQEMAEQEAKLEAQAASLHEKQEQLTGRVSGSNQFQTLKKMLAQKNQQVKELRTKLSKYEPEEEAPTADDD